MADNPNIQRICAEAFNAPQGHAIIGHVDKSGELHTKDIVVNPENENKP